MYQSIHLILVCVSVGKDFIKQRLQIKFVCVLETFLVVLSFYKTDEETDVDTFVGKNGIFGRNQ